MAHKIKAHVKQHDSNRDLINGTCKFSVHARWMSYRAKLTLVEKSSVVFVPPDANLPIADNDANVNRIIKKLSVTRPIDCFQGWYMTTPNAMKMVDVVCLLSVYGGDHWCWKPDVMCNIISCYMREVLTLTCPHW